MHYVFAKFLGKTAFIHSFTEGAEAARLTMQLRNRYAQQQTAVFWHGTERQAVSMSWPLMRRCLDDTYDRPMPLPPVKKPRQAITPLAKPHRCAACKKYFATRDALRMHAWVKHKAKIRRAVARKKQMIRSLDMETLAELRHRGLLDPPESRPADAADPDDALPPWLSPEDNAIA